MRRFGISILAMIPCFWQQRIQAGDFSSHVYNAWLANLFHTEQLSGIYLVRQTTNFLFDAILASLIATAGIDWGSRLAVAIIVLVFFWGAFAYLETWIGHHAWAMTPCLLMFTYGWTFHMGLFNFYLGAGLAFWALALTKHTGKIRWLAPVLIAMSYAASSLPAIWGVVAWAWCALGARLTVAWRFALAAGSVVGFWLITLVLQQRYNAHFSPPVVPLVPADQFWVYGTKYYGLVVAMLVLWGCMLLPLTHRPKLLSAVQPLLFLVSLACIFMIPVDFKLPGLANPVSLIQERMTLIVGIVLLAVLGQVQPARWQIIVSSAIAAVYFSFLYVDGRAMNAMETRIEQAIAHLGREDRLVYALDDPSIRSFALLQLAARPAVNRCWYYSNYEPVVGHFRIRCLPGNRITVCSQSDQEAISRGGYAVRAGEAPLYELTLCGPGTQALCVRRLEAGQKTSPRGQVSPMPRFW